MPVATAHQSASEFTRSQPIQTLLQRLYADLNPNTREYQTDIERQVMTEIAEVQTRLDLTSEVIIAALLNAAAGFYVYSLEQAAEAAVDASSPRTPTFGGWPRFAKRIKIKPPSRDDLKLHQQIKDYMASANAAIAARVALGDPDFEALVSPPRA